MLGSGTVPRFIGKPPRRTLRARVRLQSGLFIVVGATLALGSLAGCASSPESMAEHRGYEYQYALAERFRLGEGVEQDPTKAAYWYY
jgi:hypothetical protein